MVNRVKKAEEEAPEEPAGPTQEDLLSEIRDLLKR
jgi:large conductance mechanosensitive channel